MSEPQLQFHFGSPNSRNAANDLAQFLRNELPDWQQRVEEPVAPGGPHKADPLAVITLILSVPPAIESTWDLAQRIKLKEKIDRLIDWARGRSARQEPNPSVVLPPDGQAVPLDKAGPQQILDSIAAQAKAKRDQTDDHC